MPDPKLIDDICDYVDRQGSGDHPCPTGLEGFTVLRSRQPTSLETAFYNPLLCLILQGRKETLLGGQHVSFGAGESLIVSHDLPVVTRVTDASARSPYVAMVLSLNLSTVRSLYEEIGDTEIDEEEDQARTLDVGAADASLIDAMGRLFALVDRPLEARVMVPLIQREIHFRLLLARHGAMLRQLLHRESHASRIAKAITKIRQDYASTLAVGDLARIAGMSPSTFHEHFKALTETTPLQYQKNLRLLEARRLLTDGTHSVSSTAFEVGYESPTQFSREYARKFGVSPHSDREQAAAGGQ